MTLLTEIQAAQSQLLLPFTIKPLLVRSPLSIVQLLNPNFCNLWQLDPSNYGDSSDCVYLRLFLNYEVTNEVQGERGFSPTFNGTTAKHTTTRRIISGNLNNRLVILIIKDLCLRCVIKHFSLILF